MAENILLTATFLDWKKLYKNAPMCSGHFFDQQCGHVLAQPSIGKTSVAKEGKGRARMGCLGCPFLQLTRASLK